jgi:hypothetical protein
MPIHVPAQLESIYRYSCKSELYASVGEEAKAVLKDVVKCGIYQ